MQQGCPNPACLPSTQGTRRLEGRRCGTVSLHTRCLCTQEESEWAQPTEKNMLILKLKRKVIDEMNLLEYGCSFEFLPLHTYKEKVHSYYAAKLTHIDEYN